MGPALSGSHVSSSKVCFYRLGHGTGGMAQRTRWATRPTATVTLGVARVHWHSLIGHSGLRDVGENGLRVLARELLVS